MIVHNKAMHTGSATTLRFQVGVHERGAGDGDRSPRKQPERARLKSCKDDTTIARGKRGTSAALGYEPKMISLFFPIGFGAPGARQTRLEKREIGCVVAFTQGGGLGGLAPGWYYAALVRAPEAG